MNRPYINENFPLIAKIDELQPKMWEEIAGELKDEGIDIDIISNPVKISWNLGRGIKTLKDANR